MAVSKISLSELKKELIHLPAKELIEICINLAKLKRENKDYLNYTLFNANDIDGFIIEAKLEIDAQFRDSAFIYTYAVKKNTTKNFKVC